MGQPGMSSRGRTGDVIPFEQATTKSGDVSVDLLNQTHYEYDFRYEAWLDLSLLYEGGAALKNRAERLLKKRPREDEEVFACRLDGFTYNNILGLALGWYGASLFDSAPEMFFKGGSEGFYDDFLENCDTVGTGYVDFFKRVFQVLLTYGAAWVLTDLKGLEPGEDAPVTRQDERDGGFLDPHVASYTPIEVINWQYDKLGKLKWCVVKIETQEQNFLEEPQIVSTWFYYDRQNYRVWEDRRSPQEQVTIALNTSGRTAKLLREGKHALARVNRVPVRRLLLSEGLWLANRAYLLLLDHLNSDNALKFALLMSNLAVPVVIGDFDPQDMTFAEVGFLHFPSGTEYQWSEPEGKSFAQAAKRIESAREEAFRLMGLQSQGRSMHATPAMQSGRSKQLEMAPAKQTLVGMGDDVRRHMQDVLLDVRDARGDTKVEPDVRGFNFQDDMSTEEVFAVTSLLGMRIPSKTFEKTIYKKVAKAWMTDANRDELTKVYGEIEAGPTMEEREQDEFNQRVKLAKSSLSKAMMKGNRELEQPPGRGGDGPKPLDPEEKAGE